MSTNVEWNNVSLSKSSFHGDTGGVLNIAADVIGCRDSLEDCCGLQGEVLSSGDGWEKVSRLLEDTIFQIIFVVP